MLSNIYTWESDQAVKDIITVYTQQWFAIISFLYFANAMRRQIFEQPDLDTKQLAKRMLYLNALKKSHFLLPDGIALQLFYRSIRKQPIHNLNWTDFIPYFISKISKKSSVSLYLYQCYDPPKWKWEGYLEKGVNALEEHFWLVVKRSDQCLYKQRWENFSWLWLEESLAKDDNDIKIFLNCTWTPFQEIWSQEHSDAFSKHKMIVFNAWWLIDYFTWYENRAPDLVVKARVLETFWRLVTNPRKNLHKFVSMFWIIRFLRKPIVK